MAVPKLRFPGFEGEWKEHKLGEIAEIKDSARISNEFWVEKGVPYLRSSDLVNNELQGELFISKETYNKYSLQTGSPQKGDVLFTSGGKVGVTHHKEDDSDVYVQGGAILYVKTSTSEILNGSFLNIYFSTHKMRKYMENASVGGTIKHFTLIPANATPIIYPSIKEQQKIGSLFKVLDKKIQLQQEKIDLLKEQKKGFMQKIFSQELRFKDDNNQFFAKWKEVELGDITVTFSGGTPSVSNRSYYTGNIPFIRSGEIHTDKTELYISETAINKSSAKMVENGDLLYALYGATSGEVAISQINGAINQAILCIRTDENKFFIKYWLENMKEQILNVYLQGGQGNLSASIIKSLKINLPHIEEQAIIANFFGTFDKKIQREEIKLNSLIKQKQAFMQQMFI